MSLTPLFMVLAIGPGGVIGKNGGLPWRLPEDLAHFKRSTVDHSIIMGRKTFEEVKKPLPRRRNIVVSRSWELASPGVEVCATLEEAIALARTTDPEPRIIGGSGIYRAALPYVTRILLTEVTAEALGGDADPRRLGDTFFELDRSEFRETERRAGETPGVTFVTLERIAGGA